MPNPDQQERGESAEEHMAREAPSPDQQERTPGERLYHEWCESSETDQARYWHRMNPAHKRRWERLANDHEQEVKRLREALRYYADSRWPACICGPTHSSVLCRDRGRKARAALEDK